MPPIEDEVEVALRERDDAEHALVAKYRENKRLQASLDTIEKNAARLVAYYHDIPHPDAQRVAGRIEALVRGDDPLADPADETDEHVLEIRYDGWAIEHPIRCRARSLLDCSEHQKASAYMARRGGPPLPVGRYKFVEFTDLLPEGP